ncbi:hypothetical protein Bca101_025749 [Brassica carinata]
MWVKSPVLLSAVSFPVLESVSGISGLVDTLYRISGDAPSHRSCRPAFDSGDIDLLFGDVGRFLLPFFWSEKEKVRSLRGSQIRRRFSVRDRPRQADGDSVEEKEKDVDEIKPARERESGQLSLRGSQIRRRFSVRDRPRQADGDSVEEKEKDVDEMEPARERESGQDRPRQADGDSVEEKEKDVDEMEPARERESGQ